MSNNYLVNEEANVDNVKQDVGEGTILMGSGGAERPRNYVHARGQDI